MILFLQKKEVILDQINGRQLKITYRLVCIENEGNLPYISQFT